MTAFDPSYLTYDETRAEAEEFLDKYHPALTIPVPIEEIVEFDLGMEVIPVLGLRDEITGEAFLSSDLEAIYVDEDTMQRNHSPHLPPARASCRASAASSSAHGYNQSPAWPAASHR
jgi:hypothetical protein